MKKSLEFGESKCGDSEAKVHIPLSGKVQKRVNCMETIDTQFFNKLYIFLV